jgi:hypothetical protein
MIPNNEWQTFRTRQSCHNILQYLSGMTEENYETDKENRTENQIRELANMKCNEYVIYIIYICVCVCFRLFF